MFQYTTYGPYICISVVLAILFILWAFWGGRTYEFVGLAPLSPETCGSYTGSFYGWGNITPAAGYDPIAGHSCIPSDMACAQEIVREPTQQPPIIVDNTPPIPSQFAAPEVIKAVGTTSICHQESVPSDRPEPKPSTVYPVLPQPQNSVQTHPMHLPQRSRRFISRGERLCCQTMERIYGVPFTSTWPEWLVNGETNHTLELDCYNPELQIAVEYNGEQHYKWPNFTNQTYQQFLDQVRRDQLKVELCDRNGVYLIVVPYNVAYDNIPAYIMSHLPETIQKRLQEEKTLSSITA